AHAPCPMPHAQCPMPNAQFEVIRLQNPLEPLRGGLRLWANLGRFPFIYHNGKLFS
ncbi:hypothetical protein IQ246_22415, partial [aff. Roholtiella sp. LEGE 12411]|nr:hypothetical protein [aff. Roholtiella sp. LEGE 12411]